MATAGTIQQTSLGSLRRLIIPFTAIATLDTYDSGLGEQVVSHIFNNTGTVTGANSGIKVAESAGVFTFYIGVSGDTTGTLFIDYNG